MKVKRNQILNLILFIFTIISVIILYFDLGKTNFGIYISLSVNNIVPSITPTAAITLAPESSALILAISWLMIIIGAIAMILIVNWKAINYEELQKHITGWLVFGVFILIPFLIVFMMFNTPYDSGRFGRFIYFNLKEFKLFVILYGAGIWLTFSAGIFIAASLAVGSYFKKFRRK